MSKLRSIARFRGKRKERIFVAIPTLGGVVGLGIWKFLEACRKINDDPTVPWHFEHSIVNGKRPVEYARNVLAGQFLETDCERLWFLDADMRPTENLRQLLTVEGDVVAGRALIWDNKTDDKSPGLRPSVFRYNERGDYKFTPLLPAAGSQVVDADAVGTATMLVRRAVLEDPKMRVPSRYVGLDGEVHDLDDEVEREDYAPAIFRTPSKPNGEPLRGEDLDFCLRAKACGYSIRAHLGVGVGHLKTVDLEEVAQFVDLAYQRVLAARDAAPLAAAEGGSK